MRDEGVGKNGVVGKTGRCEYREFPGERMCQRGGVPVGCL